MLKKRRSRIYQSAKVRLMLDYTFTASDINTAFPSVGTWITPTGLTTQNFNVESGEGLLVFAFAGLMVGFGGSSQLGGAFLFDGATRHKLGGDYINGGEGAPFAGGGLLLPPGSLSPGVHTIVPQIYEVSGPTGSYYSPYNSDPNSFTFHLQGLEFLP
jgi:hypothetical protein